MNIPRRSFLAAIVAGVASLPIVQRLSAKTAAAVQPVAQTPPAPTDIPKSDKVWETL